MSQELESELYNLDIDKIKAVAEKYEIDCEGCDTKEDYIARISDSQKVTIEELRSHFELIGNENPSEEGDTMPGFEDAEKLLKETKTKFDSGDYNASIDTATEAISAGATALNSLLGMGLSYAIKSSEKLIGDLKSMDIDATSVEQVIENAKRTLENQEFESAKEIVNQLKESIYDLSQRQGEKINQLLDVNQSQVDEARSLGVDVSEADAKLKLARDQAASGAFTQALGSAAQVETMINSAKDARIVEIKEIINQAETTVDEAKYLNAPVEDAERLLDDAKKALSDGNYSMAIENANKASDSANNAKNEQIKKALSIQEKMMAASGGAVAASAPAESEATSEETSFELEEQAPVQEPLTEEAPSETKKVCPKCDGEPTFVDQYKRYYCYTCNEYVEPKDKEIKTKEPKPVEGEKVCPKCEGEPTYVEQYDRYFCYTCNEYVEPKVKVAEGKKEEPKAQSEKVCPKCQGEPTYVEQYDRHFCYTCNEYVTPMEKKVEETKAASAPAVKKVCPTCSEEPTYVEQYRKYYCYTCSKYVEPTTKSDKSKNACPTCGKEATYVEQYGRNYCYDCKKYL